MSEPIPPRRILHLVTPDAAADKLTEIVEASAEAASTMRIFPLTTASAREALEMIFASDTIAVWSKL